MSYELDFEAPVLHLDLESSVTRLTRADFNGNSKKASDSSTATITATTVARSSVAGGVDSGRQLPDLTPASKTNDQRDPFLRFMVPNRAWEANSSTPDGQGGR